MFRTLPSAMRRAYYVFEAKVGHGIAFCKKIIFFFVIQKYSEIIVVLLRNALWFFVNVICSDGPFSFQTWLVETVSFRPSKFLPPAVGNLVVELVTGISGKHFAFW